MKTWIYEADVQGPILEKPIIVDGFELKKSENRGKRGIATITIEADD